MKKNLALVMCQYDMKMLQLRKKRRLKSYCYRYIIKNKFQFDSTNSIMLFITCGIQHLPINIFSYIIMTFPEHTFVKNSNRETQYQDQLLVSGI